MSRVDHKTTAIVNARLSDLGYKVSVALTLPLMKIHGIKTAEEKVAKAVQKQIGAETTEAKDIQEAKALAEFEARSYLSIDTFIDSLNDLGASETELKGVRKFREKLEKKVFKKLEITQEQIDGLEGNSDE